mmetsp:Transcript_15482/g.41946  ORF Transcript_15482/g.41946 Transcript_15482/m.41946 type:complete len:209 (-) Transcript_15482:138-764(-)
MQRDVVERRRQRRERGVRDVARHVEHVGLAAGSGRDEPLREAAVVREQQQARRGLVEAADGAERRKPRRQDVEDRRRGLVALRHAAGGPACLHSSPSRRRADAAFKLVQRKVKVAPPRERLAPLLRRRLAVPRPRAPPGPRAPRDVVHLLRAQAGERREPARRVLRRVRHEASLDSRVAQEVARVALCCLLASFFAASQVVGEHCCCC